MPNRFLFLTISHSKNQICIPGGHLYGKAIDTKMIFIMLYIYKHIILEGNKLKIGIRLPYFSLAILVYASKEYNDVHHVIHLYSGCLIQHNTGEQQYNIKLFKSPLLRTNNRT
jgi:hypothetical protein